MKTFSPENTINSGLKYLFIFFWLAMAIYLIYSETNVAAIEIHPWLNGLVATPILLSKTVIILTRLFLIALSTFLAYIMSVNYFETPRKDYTLVIILPVLHFCIPDWNTGLMISVYWSAFVGIMYLLFPNNFSIPHLRRIMSAALLAGLLFTNGAFAILFFIVGIVVLVVWQTISFRATVVWITGFLLPVVYLLFYYYLTNQTDLILKNMSAIFPAETLFNFDFSIPQSLIPLVFFVLAVPIHTRLKEFKITVRRSYSSLLLSMLILLPTLISQGINAQITLALLGFSAALYWNKALYISRRKGIFVAWLFLPVFIPVLLILIKMQILVLPVF
ncbi:MAG: hypothetical protein CVU11_06195 [Bacteroidetes bacterium HGW-Bacteroidetes-6]|jgi:hypothetical protein|nr:MAG: hypothetical protein CVU11_06195 [Bacteroidetes bacterium HGW-Bacteroidetes-6]